MQVTNCFRNTPLSLNESIQDIVGVNLLKLTIFHPCKKYLHLCCLAAVQTTNSSFKFCLPLHLIYIAKVHQILFYGTTFLIFSIYTTTLCPAITSKRFAQTKMAFAVPNFLISLQGSISFFPLNQSHSSFSKTIIAFTKYTFTLFPSYHNVHRLCLPSLHGTFNLGDSFKTQITA